MSNDPEMQEMMALSIKIIAGLVIGILVLIIVLHLKHKGPEPKPKHPASLLYNIGIKLFSSLSLVIALALCGLWLVELVEGAGSTSTPEAVRSTSVYIRSYLWGMKLGSSTSIGGGPPSDGKALSSLGMLILYVISMLVLCVEDWARTFGVPNKTRLLLAVFFGYTGIWYFMIGDRAGGLIRLGFFLLGCLLSGISAFTSAGLFSAGLLVIFTLWAREIVKSANGT